jgi:hypothetical protein
MKRLIETGLILIGLLLLSLGCNKSETAEGQPAVSAPGTVVVAGNPADSHAATEICPGCGKPESQCTCGDEGKHEAKPDAEIASIELADGKLVRIVTVAALNTDPRAHKGTIAIDGSIGAVYPDKGSFIVLDNGVHCTDEHCTGCAADQKVPVRVDLAKVKGKLPAKAQRVYVIADVNPTQGGGFTLAVHEVRSGEHVLFTLAG